MDFYIWVYILLGISILGMSFLPQFLNKKPLSYSIIYLILGFIFFKFIDTSTQPDPNIFDDFTLRLTEFTVILSLMGSSLKIDRKFRLNTWKNPIWLATIIMLLSVGVVALLGYYLLDLEPPEAILLGAVLAPTNPVLASDIQTTPPNEEDEPVKFTLTAEAGMNDGMAFPFTWLAAMASMHWMNPEWDWLGDWAIYDLVYRIIVGIAAGFITGSLFATIIFRLSGKKKFPKIREGFVALAITLFTYGFTEALHGYGFLAVFFAGVTFRSKERQHHYHRELHSFTDQLERIFIVVILSLLGGSVAIGLLDALTWKGILLCFINLLLVRPLLALLPLVKGELRLFQEKAFVAFFGIRGVGSIFYLSFALHKADFMKVDELWATVAFMIILSVVVHGITASPAMNWLEKINNAKSNVT